MINFEINENGESVELIGKVAKFSKNIKASDAYDFLENIKINKNKLWYIIIEKEVVLDHNKNYQELQILKYNNKLGYDCKIFIENLKNYYIKNEQMIKYINELKIEGSEKFSIIRNIPDIIINDRKLINILSEDIINILYK